MSASHLDQMFLAPNDFLRMNLLCLVGLLPTTRGLFHFNYEPAPGTHSRRGLGFQAKAGYPTRVWHVRWVPRSARNAFPAYFMPCPPGLLVRGMMPRDGRFMLATSLPRGSFGAARYRHGGVEICHAGPESADIARISRELAWCGTRLMGQQSLATTWLATKYPRQGWNFHGQRWERLRDSTLNYHDLVVL